MDLRKVGTSVAIVTAVVVVTAAPVMAVRPSAHCGFGFELMTIEETLPLVSEGSPNPPDVLLAALEGWDANDDGLVCVKDLPDTPGSPSYVRNVVDNTAATRR